MLTIRTALPLHFNSRPHGGRQKEIEKIPYLGLFQLTPSRRATTLRQAALLTGIPFQLTPSRRATLSEGNSPSVIIFQLTPSRRATKLRMVELSTECISTHALTEGDVILHLKNLLASYFNSRPHGGRLNGQINGKMLMAYFNSRPHGGRLPQSSQCHAVSLFQLTPSRRATVNGQASFSVYPFQLTPSRRATRAGSSRVSWVPSFQLTPSRRATR